VIGSLPAAALCACLGAAPPPVIELWVDASSAPNGNGTAQRPFKTLAAGLAEAGQSGARIHLAAGLYRGPFHPADSTLLEGSGAAVLFAEGSEIVIEPRGKLELANLIVQGGAVGIETASDLRLNQVSFSGQRKLGVHLSSGSLFADRTNFSAAVSDAGAIRAERNARLALTRCAFQGPYRRALALNAPGRAELDDCSFDGAVTGVHQVGGSAAVHRTRFSGGRGPALFCARGTLELVDVDVYGHEYALQSGEKAIVRALRFSSVRADRAGIALTRANAQLEEITIADSGSFGAVQLVDSTVALRRFRFQHPEAYGLVGRQSHLSVSDGAITDVTDNGGSAGEGIHLRATRGTIESVSVLRTAGAGLLAAEDSTLELRDFSVEKCHWAGVIAETLARISGSSWTIRKCDAPAIAIPDAAEIEVDVLRSEGNAQGVFWVECARGARLRVSRAQGDPIETASNSCAVLAR
jgi:hypothetical protein